MTSPMSEDLLGDRSGRIVAAHRLLRRRGRLQAGQFLADGAQAVREAVAAHAAGTATVLELYVTEAAADRQVEIVRAALRADIEVTAVTDRAAAKLSDAVTPQGITARCAWVERTVDDLWASGPTLLAVLVGTADPGNAGTVIRLADATGADAVVMAGDTVDPWGPKTVRASVGSVFHLPVVRAADPLELIARLRERGLTVLATAGAEALPTGAAATELEAARADGLLAGPVAWLFGSEAHGLPGAVITAADHAVTVPIYGRAESLNLATAAAVCLYASAAVTHAS